jgi:hypothetical protein
MEFPSNLPQELRQIVEDCSKTESQTFEKITFNTFVKSLTLIGVLRETGWGKMSIMTEGSLQIFIKNATLTGVLQVRVHVFRKTMLFIHFV